jgi:hypothetical protein
MWRLKIFSLAVLLISSTGCAVVSLHPLALPDDADKVFDPKLEGTWEEVEFLGFSNDSPGNRYAVKRAGSGYAVTELADGTELTMKLLKIGGQYVLDLYCPSDGPTLPVHIFLRLRLDQDKAWLAVLDSNWFREQISANSQLRHEFLSEDDRIILTASSTELRRALAPYIKDNRSFEDEEELKRIN